MFYVCVSYDSVIFLMVPQIYLKIPFLNRAIPKSEVFSEKLTAQSYAGVSAEKDRRSPSPIPHPPFENFK